MIDFLKRFFGSSNSSSTAKDRLRLVLMTDHLALAPEIIEQMKRDLIDVISRYVEVDRDKVEVNFEREDRALAMLANIPIVAVNRPKSDDTPKTVVPAVAAVEIAPAPPAPPPKRRRRRKAAGLAAAPKAAPAS